MKIIREPKLYLVGKPKLLDEGVEQFLEDHELLGEGKEVCWVLGTNGAKSDGETIPEMAGRICYMSFSKPRPGGNAAYLKHIKEAGHGSVLEHAVWNFIITGISRSCSHELVRHRAGWAFSQLSQRYVDESVAEYVCPDVIANNPGLFSQWKYAIGIAHGTYVDLSSCMYTQELAKLMEVYAPANLAAGKINTLNQKNMEEFLVVEERTACRKAARQAARSVLPNATETKIFGTVNARAARHFIELRCSRHAEPEIRKVAYAMLGILSREAPNLFSDYTTTPLPDGTFEASTPYRKV